MPGVNKRAPEVSTECQRVKRRRLDRCDKLQCGALLKKLMGHPAGWVFNQPVDPVKLGIPDYFNIITKPMDLGTVKSKLEKYMYSGIQEFAADIRLTFDNATRYNPPDNSVHKMAKELCRVFEVGWEAIYGRRDSERSVAGEEKNFIEPTKEVNKPNSFLPKTSKKMKQSGGKEIRKSSEGKVIGSSSNARDVEGKVVKPAKNHEFKSLKITFSKGLNSDRKFAVGPAIAKQPLINHTDDPTHSSSDVSAKRLLGTCHHACGTTSSILEYKAESTLSSQMSKSDPQSDGALSSFDGENITSSSQITLAASDATPDDEWRSPPFDAQLSPEKALRATMLRSRFLDTILKAQQKTLLNHGAKADPVKMQKEKERLEKKQREEKARIEAQIRAESVLREQAENELKRRREKEREAARIALQKMEEAVKIEQNLEVLKELEMLCGCSLSYRFLNNKNGSRVIGGADLWNPLEKLGLFMKDDQWEDVEDEGILFRGDVEEGEILL